MTQCLLDANLSAVSSVPLKLAGADKRISFVHAGSEFSATGGDDAVLLGDHRVDIRNRPALFSFAPGAADVRSALE